MGRRQDNGSQLCGVLVVAVLWLDKDRGLMCQKGHHQPFTHILSRMDVWSVR